MGCRFPPLIALAVLLSVPLSMRAVAQSQAKPSEPIAGVLKAFETHRIVGIPDAHRNTAIHACLLSLIRDPRLPTVVNDIVVEFGNGLHQDVADRFVRGEDVRYETLRNIWLDTTQAQPASDTPQPWCLRPCARIQRTWKCERVVWHWPSGRAINWTTIAARSGHQRADWALTESAATGRGTA
jgi:hypothetical protein